MGLAFADYDNDGFTDVFVSNDTFQNFLLHNNGDGTFKDRALEAGVAYTATGRTVAGMGAEFRDLNNDGLPDIFHTAMFGDTFPIYKNTGDLFEDVTDVAGVTAFSHRLTGWGTGAFDFDNDGNKDLFMPAGPFWITKWRYCTARLYCQTVCCVTTETSFSLTEVQPQAQVSLCPSPIAELPSAI